MTLDASLPPARHTAAHPTTRKAPNLDEQVKDQAKGTNRTITIQEIAFAVFSAHNYPEGTEPSLDSDATFDPENFSFPHGTHLCAAEVDTETGWVKIRSYVCVDDVGTVVNPLIVEGQVHGGVVQGIAQALFEEAVYDEGGTLISGTLADYLVPTAADLPSFITDRTETPATSNPLGVKGVGEAGTIASTPAVVNALLDAVRHLGVTDIDMPCSPQRVWRAVQSARGAAKSTSEHATGAAAGGGLGSIDAQGGTQ
jgi:aerobic carbon-monoxide dehydrogenase large subunit